MSNLIHQTATPHLQKIFVYVQFETVKRLTLNCQGRILPGRRALH